MNIEYIKKIKTIFVSHPDYGDKVIDIYDEVNSHYRNYVNMIIQDFINGESKYLCYRRLVVNVIEAHDRFINKEKKFIERMKENGSW